MEQTKKQTSTCFGTKLFANTLRKFGIMKKIGIITKYLVCIMWQLLLGKSVEHQMVGKGGVIGRVAAFRSTCNDSNLIPTISTSVWIGVFNI